MDPKDWIALASAVVALLSMVVTIVVTRTNHRREKLNQRMQYVNLKQQYFHTLREWADHLSDVLSESIHLCKLDPEKCPPNWFFEQRNRLRIILSSMIDRGRWFFPNLDTEAHGLHKHRAFRGYRQEVLNSLVTAYKAVTTLNYVNGADNQQRRQELVDAKKQFVSEIQSVLNPARQDQEYKEITIAINSTHRKQSISSPTADDVLGESTINVPPQQQLPATG